MIRLHRPDPRKFKEEKRCPRCGLVLIEERSVFRCDACGVVQATAEEKADVQTKSGYAVTLQPE